jgi:hypothetical protein
LLGWPLALLDGLDTGIKDGLIVPEVTYKSMSETVPK